MSKQNKQKKSQESGKDVKKNSGLQVFSNNSEVMVTNIGDHKEDIINRDIDLQHQHEEINEDYEDDYVFNQIPHVSSILDQYDEHYKNISRKFEEEVLRNFKQGTSKHLTCFIIHNNIQYRWQQKCLDRIFKNKNYIITYKNETSRFEDNTYAELTVPGFLNLQEKCHL